MGVYPLGTEVTVFHTFTLDDVPTDPTGITVTVELPDETLETFVFGVDAELTNPSVGYYELAYLPATSGTYNYRIVGTGAVAAASEGSFTVAASSILGPTPFEHGPCESWVDGHDVWLCCASARADVGSFTSLLDASAQTASQMLYELSGRRWAGMCSRTVRPCHSACGCGWQVLSRGHVVASDSWSCEGRACGCRDLSRVRLSGYPVIDVTQVKIDGDVLSSSEYRVDENRWLTRLNGERWPSCARLDLADTEDGTFSVTYQYGSPPPLMGLEAAQELACQIFLQCSGTAGEGECQLPAGVTRITRQGITIERTFFARNPNTGAWQTGLRTVDAFLNAYNPRGLPRRAVFWGPGSRERHARKVG